MGFQPKSRTARANLSEVRPLASIADERRTLKTEFLDGSTGPHISTSGEFDDILGMTVDAALGDVDLASALHLSELRRSIDREKNAMEIEDR